MLEARERIRAVKALFIEQHEELAFIARDTSRYLQHCDSIRALAAWASQNPEHWAFGNAERYLEIRDVDYVFSWIESRLYRDPDEVLEATVSRAAVPLMVSHILDRPARWTPPGSFLGGYDGADRTVQVFNTAVGDQLRLLERLEPHRPLLERYASGPVVILFYTTAQSRKHDLSTAALPERGE